jgi:hypothetical protein
MDPYRWRTAPVSLPLRMTWCLPLPVQPLTQGSTIKANAPVRQWTISTRRLGQSERGSYVLTVISLLPPIKDAQKTLFGPADPF